MQQKIKAPVKVNPFSVVCFLIGQDYCALTSQCLAEQAPDCMNIRRFMAPVSSLRDYVDDEASLEYVGTLQSK